MNSPGVAVLHASWDDCPLCIEFVKGAIQSMKVLVTAAWVQSLSAIVGRGNYPALDPDLYQHVMRSYGNPVRNRGGGADGSDARGGLVGG